MLVVSLPGDTQHMYANDTENGESALKTKAESLLAEFTSSLGAVFSDAAAADLRSRADEMESYADGGDEGRHDRSMFATGMRRSADLIEHGDIPATPAPMAGEKES
jgi:hypothetical protein